MAIRPALEASDVLDGRMARMAAGVSGALSLAGTIAAAIGLIHCLTAETASAPAPAYVAALFLLAVLGAVGVAGSGALLRQQVWAQQFLLVYWLAVLVALTVLGLGCLLGGAPADLAKLAPGAAPGRFGAVLGAVALLLLIPGGAAAAMLVMASIPKTRQRYASMVLVSVGAALALAIVVNMLAQYENPEKARKNYFHISMETLGRYSLSDRTKKILADVQEPIRLTCVYTSGDQDKQTDERRPRVLELLEDMKLYGRKMEVASITSDAEKDRVISRLRGEQGTQADAHVTFLQKFDKDCAQTIETLTKEQKDWERQPADSYLNMWSLSVEAASQIKQDLQKLQLIREKVSKGVAGPGLPNYADLVRDVKDAVKPLRESLEELAKDIEKIRKIAETAKDEKKRAVALAAVDQFLNVAKEMAQAVGGEKDPDPKEPGEALNKYVAAARRAAQLAAAAAGQIDNVGGSENTEMLRQNRFFIVVLGNIGIPLSGYYRRLGQAIANAADEAEAVVKNAKSEYQLRFIQNLRPEVPRTAAVVEQARQAAAEAIGKLAAVDQASQDLLARAGEGKLLAALLAGLKATLDEADKLPELKDTNLASDISGENIVIVEAGKKVQVVGFDEVWPLKVQAMGPSFSEGPQKRTFNGDAAIASKVLSMVYKPFATVLLTYWGAPPNMPPQMSRMIPPAEIPVQALSTLRKRMEEANFEVKEWNLSEDMPETDKDRPKLLIVLPPPPSAGAPPFGPEQPTPQFTPEHARKVQDAIESGVPALFLATYLPQRSMGMFMPPIQPTYGFGDYLRKDWGIDVMADYLVIPAVTDETAPDRFKVDAQLFWHLPLSAFSDHPIGEPLQAQRVLWCQLCPIGRARDAHGDVARPPQGATIQPLLSVPGDWKATWATRRVRELVAEFENVEGSFIRPDYGKGDLHVPFDVAVAATRPENSQAGTKPARIVVLGVGGSLMDGYLDRGVLTRDSKGAIALSDPPRADADLAINSLYWLVGRQNLIAAGPPQAAMREIPANVRILLIAVYCGLLPVAVLGAGGLVLLKRRR